jgi:hypothetical protein
MTDKPRIIYVNEYDGKIHPLCYTTEEAANKAKISTHNAKRIVRKFVEVIND